MILDTCFVVDLMDGDTDAVDRARALADGAIPEHLAAVTVFELHHGIWRRDYSEAERERVTAVLDTKVVLPTDGAVMAEAGKLHARLENEGRPIGVFDTMIAATARVTDEPVLTRNDEHFERVEGVAVETY